MEEILAEIDGKLNQSQPIVPTQMFTTVLGITGSFSQAQDVCPDDWNLESWSELHAGSSSNKIFIIATKELSFIGSRSGHSVDESYLKLELDSNDVSYLCWKVFDKQQYDEFLILDNENCPLGYQDIPAARLVDTSDDGEIIQHHAGTYVGGNPSATDLSTQSSKRMDGRVKSTYRTDGNNAATVDRVCWKRYNDDHIKYPVFIFGQSESACPAGFASRTLASVDQTFGDKWYRARGSPSGFHHGAMNPDGQDENYFWVWGKDSHFPTPDPVVCWRVYETTYPSVEMLSLNANCPAGEGFTELPVNTIQRTDSSRTHSFYSNLGMAIGGYWDENIGASRGGIVKVNIDGTGEVDNVCFKIRNTV